MKFQLMIQSLSPLFLLTIIKNFSFKCFSEAGEKLSYREFLCENSILVFVLSICFIWVIYSIIVFFMFGAFRYSGKKHGYSIFNITENNEASLNFLLTLIIPLLIDDIDTLQGAISFCLIVLLICVLLYRTTLFYDNPVLSILGYHIYSFEFIDKSEYPGLYIGVSKGTVHSDNSIEFKAISKNVLYIKEDVNNEC